LLPLFSPIAGHYGAVAGFIAGASSSYFKVVNIGFLQGGIILSTMDSQQVSCCYFGSFLEALIITKQAMSCWKKKSIPAMKI